MSKPYNVLNFSEPQQEMIHFFNRFAEVMDLKEAQEVETLKGWIVKNVEVFRAGTWRGLDYTEQDIQDMVDNFKTLKENGTFDPVFKKDHSESVADQVGWIYDVRKDGDTLLADIHITDWMTQDKVREGTWKNLSAEIYPPALALDEFGIESHVLRAVAIVSVPKVKGLKGLILNSEILDENQGGNIMDRDQMLALLKKLNKFSEDELNGLSDEDLIAKFSEAFEQQATPAAPGTNPGGTPAPAPAAPQVFSENGQQFVVMTQADFKGVAESMAQANNKNIDLFAEVAALRAESRKDKIEKRIGSLLNAGKITPAEKEGIEKFAEKLEGDSYEEYFQTFEARTPVAVFGELGGAPAGSDDEDEQVKAMLAELNVKKTF